MDDLYKIGTRIYTDYTDRLFVYQFGDGFIVCPQGGDENLERPVSIAIATLQAAVLREGVARAAISQGEIADILGCYSQEIQRNLKEGCISLGVGLMTICQVMGEAVIKTYGLYSRGPKGPLLLLDDELKSEVHKISGLKINTYSDGKGKDFVGINWVYSELPLVKSIMEKIDLISLTPEVLKKLISDYINNNTLSGEWVKNANILIKNHN